MSPTILSRTTFAKELKTGSNRLGDAFLDTLEPECEVQVVNTYEYGDVDDAKDALGSIADHHCYSRILVGQNGTKRNVMFCFLGDKKGLGGISDNDVARSLGVNHSLERHPNIADLGLVSGQVSPLDESLPDDFELVFHLPNSKKEKVDQSNLALIPLGSRSPHDYVALPIEKLRATVDSLERVGLVKVIRDVPPVKSAKMDTAGEDWEVKNPILSRSLEEKLGKKILPKKAEKLRTPMPLVDLRNLVGVKPRSPQFRELLKGARLRILEGNAWDSNGRQWKEIVHSGEVQDITKLYEAEFLGYIDEE